MKHIRFFSDLSGDIDILKQQVKKLEVEQELMEKIIQFAPRNGMVLPPTAMEWLISLRHLNHEAKQLTTEAENLVAKSCHPKLGRSSYKMGKKLAVMKEKMTEIGNLYLDIVSFPAASPDITEPPSLMKGQMSVFNDTWNCLKQEETIIIGIFGDGGIGKTTILQKLLDRLLQKDHYYTFDVIIFCKVCRVPNVNKIQDKIRMELGIFDYLWKNKSPNERTKDIFSILSQKKFVLLLDDVWEGFDLSQVGVPLPQENVNGSKVVLTARSLQACAAMDVTIKHFEVKSLLEDDAWTLFSTTAGEEAISSDPLITKLAKDILVNCGGLPLDIVTAAGGLARKGTDHANRWESWLKNVHDIPVSDRIVSILELRYSVLDDEVQKSCFRYCSLLPFVDRDHLVAYWIGEGILGEFTDGNDARARGYNIIDTLEKEGLLMGEGSAVRMHDVVREVALHIAKEAGEKFLVRAGAYLTEAPKVDEWIDAHRVSLTYNGIEELPKSPSCPVLSTLILTKCGLKTISGEFFESMPSLKILDLSWCEMDEIPSTIACLLGLKYLNLSHTSITELPVEFKKLVNLEIFILNNTAELNAIPKGMIEGLPKLQVLDMYRTGDEEWIAEGDELLVGSEEFIEELKGLKILNQLGISIKDVKGMERLQSTHEVQLSTDSLLLLRCKGLKCLELSSIQFMVSLRMLEIYDCADLLKIQIKDLFLATGCFYSLKHVHIEGCWSLPDLTWLSVVPNLKTLHVHRCMKLKEVISTDDATGRAAPHSHMFPRLVKVCLANLPNLSSICASVISSRVLEEIRVSYCPKLKQLPIDHTSIPKTFKMIEGQDIWWNNLKWKNDNDKNILLPYYRGISY